MKPAIAAPVPETESEPRPDLSVILVTHRTRADARNCLASLLADGGLDGLDAEVLLIDNASGDGTVEMVRDEFPAVRLFPHEDNRGFAHANNEGIAASRGRLILLLNPDTLVPRGELAKCVHYLDSQPVDVAAMSCRVESPDGSVQWACARRLITPWSETCRALLLDRIFAHSPFFNPEPMPGWDRSDARPVECLLGAFMLMRRDALEQIGGLDERFFLMYEDTDWCRRAADAGFRLLYWPGARITHLGGQSWKKEPVVVFANAHLSAMTYFRKHHPRAVGFLRAVSRFGMEQKIALLRLKLLRRPNDAYAQTHLEMARAARRTLRDGSVVPYGNWEKTAEAERLANAGTPPPAATPAKAGGL